MRCYGLSRLPKSAPMAKNSSRDPLSFRVERSADSFSDELKYIGTDSHCSAGATAASRNSGVI